LRSLPSRPVRLSKRCQTLALPKLATWRCHVERPFLMESVGRAAAARLRRGKSGLHGDTVPANGRRGRPQGKCHREETASAHAAARVKRCGKSAPRFRQRKRHGKPHREQSRIGMAAGAIPRSVFGSAIRVGCSRRRVSVVPEEWPPRGSDPALQNPAYRPADALSEKARRDDRRAFAFPSVGRSPPVSGKMRPFDRARKLPLHKQSCFFAGRRSSKPGKSRDSGQSPCGDLSTLNQGTSGLNGALVGSA